MKERTEEEKSPSSRVVVMMHEAEGDLALEAEEEDHVEGLEEGGERKKNDARIIPSTIA